MKPILFNAQMVRAIFDGRKTQTRRIMKPQPVFTEDLLKTQKYAVDDILYVRETWCKVPGLPHYVYKASCYDGITRKWHPSIHMPKEAARIFLRVTDVRAERLQDITIDDAIAEGCNEIIPITEFRLIWSKTIKPANRDRYGWHANPWVWVYTFERYDPADPEGGADG